MRVPPVPPGALPLLDDLLHRGQRGGQVGDRDQLRPPDQLRGGLGARRADEHRPLTDPVDQPAQPVGDAPVQVAHGAVLLAARQQFVRRHRRARRRRRDEALRVLQLHPLRPLQVQEVPQRLLAERQQVQLHPGREVPGTLREVGPAQVRGGADGGHEVRDQRQVQHLLDGDAAQRPSPPVHRGGLLAGQPVGDAVLQAELGVQVLAHDHVFELGGLREQPPQVLPMRYHDPGFRHDPILDALITRLQPNSTKYSDDERPVRSAERARRWWSRMPWCARRCRCCSSSACWHSRSRARARLPEAVAAVRPRCWWWLLGLVSWPETGAEQVHWPRRWASWPRCWCWRTCADEEGLFSFAGAVVGRPEPAGRRSALLGRGVRGGVGGHRRAEPGRHRRAVDAGRCFATADALRVRAPPHVYACTSPGQLRVAAAAGVEPDEPAGVRGERAVLRRLRRADGAALADGDRHEYVGFRWVFADDLHVAAVTGSVRLVAGTPWFALAVAGRDAGRLRLAEPAGRAAGLDRRRRGSGAGGPAHPPGDASRRRAGCCERPTRCSAASCSRSEWWSSRCAAGPGRRRGACTGPGGADFAGLLAAAGLAAVLANLLNNLPATLMLAPLVARSPGLVLAVLLGVNLGPNLTYVWIAGHRCCGGRSCTPETTLRRYGSSCGSARSPSRSAARRGGGVVAGPENVWDDVRDGAR